MTRPKPASDQARSRLTSAILDSNGSEPDFHPEEHLVSASALPQGVEEALRRPLGFAQVREDPSIDLEAVRTIAARSVFMIASGGCTAAALAGFSTVSTLVMVDPNASQLALTRIKLRLLAYPPARRLELLGHQSAQARERAAKLCDLLQQDGLPDDALGNLAECARYGPDFFGRYEWLFGFLHSALSSEGIVAQALGGARIDQSALEEALRPAFERTFEISLLRQLFGAQATQNAALPFAEHFLRQTLLAFRLSDPRSNRFLWEMLAPGRGKLPPLWTRAPQCRPAARLEFLNQPANEALRAATDKFDLIHLSNILDWLSEDQARETLGLARAALASKGMVLVRQLNSTLDIPRLGEGLAWQRTDAAELVRQDQSFFYRALHRGTKQ